MNDVVDVADRLHSLAIHILRMVRREDPAMGLTPARASALSVIVYAGPVTMGQLAKAEQVSSPTMTRIVDQLVRDGWVEREAIEADGRRTLVRATDAGAEVCREGRQKRIASLARRLEPMSGEELRTLRRAADILAEALGHPHHE